MDDDGYEGPAVLAVEGRAEFTVRARLTGSFQPLDGRYRWYGRLEAHEELTRMVGDRSAGVVLRTSEGERGGPHHRTRPVEPLPDRRHGRAPVPNSVHH